MAYSVNIIPGRETVDIVNIDENLKAGCEEAALTGKKIYVCGDYRSGKTTVLKYFMNKAWDMFGVKESEILFLSCEQFINMVTEGIRSNDMTEFRDKLAEAKMIIIDDIQFFAGKNAIQCEFRNVLEMDKVIIVSGVDESERFPLDEFVVNMLKPFTVMEITKY